MKTYVTFGSDHTHKINGQLFNYDCVAVVNGDREKVFEIFGSEFCFEYPEEHWDDKKMKKHFTRGYIEVKEQQELDSKWTVKKEKYNE